ncbi:MAG: hypothetical protein LC799_06730 [Actinobacteria bacterium]|nr:hypothetical protein [Actinomycetota bacterium]
MSSNRSIKPEERFQVPTRRQPPTISAAATGTGVTARTAAHLAATGERVLVAVWCCSVGATWTVELYEFATDATWGKLVEWISSGVPTSQPEPDQALARALLNDCGLDLYPVFAAGTSTRSRRTIGYVQAAPG